MVTSFAPIAPSVGGSSSITLNSDNSVTLSKVMFPSKPASRRSRYGPDSEFPPIRSSSSGSGSTAAAGLWKVMSAPTPATFAWLSVVLMSTSAPSTTFTACEKSTSASLVSMLPSSVVVPAAITVSVPMSASTPSVDTPTWFSVTLFVATLAAASPAIVRLPSGAVT